MKQSNFHFLKDIDKQLYQIALAAERNYPGDPNTTMAKLRIFGEAIAKKLALALKIERTETQLDIIRELAKVPGINDDIIQVFHKLRRVGNKAVHEYHDDLPDAEMTLRLAYKLAGWYYSLKTNQFDYVLPTFQLPKGELGAVLEAEILDLKVKLQQANNKKTTTDKELAEKENTVVSLQGYISILESKQTETQAQAEARIKALEAELRAKDAELASKTADQRKAYHAEVRKSAAKRSLNLSEAETRYLIDEQLRKAGWDADSQNLNYAKGARPQVGRNIAIAEWPTGKDETGNLGFADYVLFGGLKPIAVIEAKKQNKDVCDKLNEAYRYAKTFDYDLLKQEITHAEPDQIKEAIPHYLVTWPDTSGTPFKIPFCFSTNGRAYRATVRTKSGIWYRDVRHSTNMPKALPEWHRPEELIDMLAGDKQAYNEWFAENPITDELGLRYYQKEAVEAVEKAVIEGQQDILLAMATGTGKTRTAIALMYRLIQSQRFKRILFLVDRTSLGEQALDSFEDTTIKGDTFKSIFKVSNLTDKFPDDATKIHVATVQSLVKRTLQSDEVMPVRRYDCIIVDEAHRGYVLDKEQTEGEEKFRDLQDYISSYRRIIDHFDAVKIALTATPALHTNDIFGGVDKTSVYRYSYRKAVIDGHLVDQEPPVKIITKLARDNVYIGKGAEVMRLSPQGELLNDTLEDEQAFEVADFNRGLIVSNFNKVVCEELVNHLDPTNKERQKTLVFCVNNTHADIVVEELRTAFKQKYPELEHDAIIKITGDSDKDSKKIQSLITRYKKDRLPNIVVTVDLLTTGIDIPYICNLVFLRKVRSRILYEQMKGRATRLCPAAGKTSFKIFDAVDLYSTLQSVDTMHPVVVRPQVTIQTLINEITAQDTYQSLEADGRSFAEHSHEQLVTKLQRITLHARSNQDRSKEVDSQIKRLDEILKAKAGCDFFSLPNVLKTKGAKQTAEILNGLPNFAHRLEQLKASLNELREMPIFTDIPDEVIEVTSKWGEHEKPEDFLEAFDNLVSASVNQQQALATIINRPRDLTRKSLLELQEWFDAQNYDESTLRKAWKATKNQDIAARLIGHIRRAAIGDALLPFETRVNHALDKIKQSKEWNPAQLSWLERLASSIKQQVVLDDTTFKTGNYKRSGGKRKLETIFEDELASILSQFYEYIWDEPA